MKQPIPNTQDQNITQPVVKPLSRVNRTVIFVFFVLLFLVSVPVFVFYATGYRFNIFEQEKGIVVTGGLYVGTPISQAEIFVNDELVRGSRLFRQGTYIQNVIPGVQQVHVQAPGRHTWVKKVPVSPYIVTEVEAFLMPVVPQVRVITEFLDSANRPVLDASSTAFLILETASSTQNFVLASTSLARTYQENPEFALLTDLFTPATSSTTTTKNVTDTSSFRFAQGGMQVASTATPTALATTTIINESMVLFESDNQLFARYSGSPNTIPSYFCVPTASLASTTELFGAHVWYEIEKKLTGPTQMSNDGFDTAERICRTTIRIDTRFQTPRSFYFLPNETDFVLLHIDEGVFVVEIDDRSWQNVQQVYPASAEKVIVDNNRIYIKEGDVYIELYTKLLTP